MSTGPQNKRKSPMPDNDDFNPKKRKFDVGVEDVDRAARIKQKLEEKRMNYLNKMKTIETIREENMEIDEFNAN